MMRGEHAEAPTPEYSLQHLMSSLVHRMEGFLNVEV